MSSNPPLTVAEIEEQLQKVSWEISALMEKKIQLNSRASSIKTQAQWDEYNREVNELQAVYARASALQDSLMEIYLKELDKPGSS